MGLERKGTHLVARLKTRYLEVGEAFMDGQPVFIEVQKNQVALGMQHFL
jgi:hypothetical protein